MSSPMRCVSSGQLYMGAAMVNNRCNRWPMRLLMIILLAKWTFASTCKRNRNGNIDLNNTKEKVTACIAQCLDLINPLTRASSTQCKYSDSNGKAWGDNCTENFQPVSNSKVIFCELKTTDELSSSLYYWKACDFIIHLHGVKYTKGAGLKLQADMMAKILPRVEEAKRYRMKNILQIGSHDDINMAPEDLSSVAESLTERFTFAKDISALLKEHKFDGVYIYWRFPGCPNMICNRRQDKANMVHMFREIYQLLAPEGKKLLYYTTALYIIPAHYFTNTYFNDVAPFVDYIVLEASPQYVATDENSDYVYNYLKTKGIMKSVTSKMTNSTIKKVIMTATFKSIQSTLVDANKSQIGAKVIVGESKQVGLVKICQRVRNNSWKIEKNINAQHLLKFSPYVIPYDDFDSMKFKMDNIVIGENYAGLLIEDTASDDQRGKCGCGRMPWLRTVGEILKGGNCVMKPCF